MRLEASHGRKSFSTQLIQNPVDNPILIGLKSLRIHLQLRASKRKIEKRGGGEVDTELKTAIYSDLVVFTTKKPYFSKFSMQKLSPPFFDLSFARS